MEKDGRKVWLVLAKPFESASVPPIKGVVRVDDFLQSAVLCSDGKGGTKGENLLLLKL